MCPVKFSSITNLLITNLHITSLIISKVFGIGSNFSGKNSVVLSACYLFFNKKIQLKYEYLLVGDETGNFAESYSI